MEKYDMLLNYVITLRVLSVVLLVEAIAGYFFYRFAGNVKVCLRHKNSILLLLFVVYIILMFIATYIRFAQNNDLIQEAYSWVWVSGTLGAGILLVGYRLHNKRRE